MKSKQKEFDNMPERTKLGKKCIEFLNAKDEIDTKKEILETTKNELIEVFLAEGKKSITIEGRIISYSHTESDKIIVKE